MGEARYEALIRRGLPACNLGDLFGANTKCTCGASVHADVEVEEGCHVCGRQLSQRSRASFEQVRNEAGNHLRFICQSCRSKQSRQAKKAKRQPEVVTQ